MLSARNMSRFRISAQLALHLSGMTSPSDFSSSRPSVARAGIAEAEDTRFFPRSFRHAVAPRPRVSLRSPGVTKEGIGAFPTAIARQMKQGRTLIRKPDISVSAANPKTNKSA